MAQAHWVFVFYDDKSLASQEGDKSDKKEGEGMKECFVVGAIIEGMPHALKFPRLVNHRPTSTEKGAAYDFVDCA